MTLLDIQREALRRASDARLLQHMRRLDNVAAIRGFGYVNPRLDAAEAQRVAEVWRRKPYEYVLSAAHAHAHTAHRDAAQAELARRQAEPRFGGTDTSEGA